jgi:DNA primase|tara:strand:- start:762 stop:2468 length:1707 start_codon:yes stop_codon:yes gene_type:complete
VGNIFIKIMYKNENLKEEIRNRLKLSEVIGKNLSLKKKDDSNYIALCPFHKEKTPSFSISDEKGFYHCFGCGKHGDLFSYVMETENIGFVDVLSNLAEQAGINLSNYDNHKNHDLDVIYNLIKRASDSYIKNLNSPIGEKAKNYLIQRNVPPSHFNEYLIGYSGNLKSNKFLVSSLLKEGFIIDDIIKVGLAKKAVNNNLIFYFQERIMIPILNDRGRVVAFGGRLIKAGEPKYLNSPETPLFHKGKQLFGVFNAKKLKKKKRFIVCEGYMDVITLSKFGYPAVATLGTSVTEDQINNVFNVTDEAFLVFDGDVAGRRAAIRVFEKNLSILKIKKIFKFVFLPENLDPEDFITKYGENEFEKMLDNALSMIDFLWMEGLKLIKKEHPETNAIFWSFLRNKVKTIEDYNLKLAYSDEIEKRIKVYRNNSQFSQFKNVSKRNIFNNYKLIEKQKLPKTGVEKKFEAIIYIMILCPSVCQNFDEKISLLDFRDHSLNEFKDLILKLIFNTPNINSEKLQSDLINEGFAIQLRKIMQSNISSRLNLDENKMETENVHDILKELLHLINIKMH